MLENMAAIGQTNLSTCFGNNLGGNVRLMALKVSKNIEINRPLLGANESFSSVITC